MSARLIERLVLVLAAAGALWAYGCERERGGQLRGEMSVLAQQRDALAKQQQIVRTQFVHDTVRLIRTVTKYETLVDSITRVDTLTIRERVIVAAADTAIKACRETVRSCAASIAIADSIHRGDLRMIHALEAQRPGFARRWGERLLWAGAGYAAGSIFTRR